MLREAAIALSMITLLEQILYPEPELDNRCTTEYSHEVLHACECYRPDTNTTDHLIDTALDHVSSYTKTDDIKYVADAVALLEEVVNISTKMVDTIRELRDSSTQPAGHDNCTDLFYTLENRTANYRAAYHEMLVHYEMARIRLHMLWYYLPPLVIIIFVCGIIGNGILLLIFAKHPETRSGPRVILISLTVSDTLLLLFNVVTEYYLMLRPFPLGNVSCYVYNFLVYLPRGASIYSMLALTFSRYLATRAVPGDRVHKVLQHNMSSWVAVVWGVASLQTLLSVLESKMVGHTRLHTVDCDIASSIPNAVSMFLIVCFLPFVAIIIFSAATSRRLRKTAGTTTTLRRLELAKERNARILPGLTLLFAVTYPPFYTFWLIVTFFDFPLSSLTCVIYYSTYYLFNLNSALNPLVLYHTSDMFKEYFRKYLFLPKKVDKLYEELEMKFWTLTFRNTSMESTKSSTVF